MMVIFDDDERDDDVMSDGSLCFSYTIQKSR